MWEQLRQDSITISLPNNIEGWEDDVKKLPRITYSSRFSYFLNSAASDGEAMNSLKSSEVYQCLHSNKVGYVLLKEIVGHNLIYLKQTESAAKALKSPITEPGF